ncbi:hypothetical protein [Guptibacillus algicola]|uniref:hypothetical protein n=1 Tax=Guptibacillus algicola TaxID=225844 RepID=UPI001CD78D2B|nr:hypothetical protein [Alkalihalobacillus algicola]MCA0987684.1 hypothetical protein [Alkalihalobacillus algicola]
MFMRKGFFFLFLAGILVACNANQPPPTVEEKPVEAKKPQETNVMEQSYYALSAIKNGDMNELAAVVHPNKGVLFSPYMTVDKNRAQVFMKGQLEMILDSDKQYEWGVSAGKGDPIRLTPREYFDQYVYDVDFLETDFVTLDAMYKQTNSVENIQQAFPESTYVEYFVPGSEEFDGLDWKSLKLVFMDYEGEPHLVGIIHDQWTP